MKAFLSHSSKQKTYVEQVAKILGKDNIAYDAWTFEEGGKTLDEIYKGIEKSGIFVFFISIDALNSDWVKRELLIAKKFVNEHESVYFKPIIIDDNIDYKHEKIPDWMRTYNIKYIINPGRSAFLIKNELFSLSLEKKPRLKKEEQLFIGRNEEKKRFEELYGDIKPSTLIVSGLPKVGKQKFIKKMLKDYNIIEEHYKPIILNFDRRDSIEDLISRLYSLGYSKNESLFENTNLIDTPMSTKINICRDLIYELRSCGEMLFILDNQFIFKNNGEASNWFIELIKGIKNKDNEIVFCVTSTTKFINRSKFFNNNEILYLSLNEFNKIDRKNYFERLLKIYEIDLSKKDFDDLLDVFSGMPEQIKYSIDQILTKERTITQCIEDVIAYNKNSSQLLISEYENNTLAMQLLKLLSMGEFFSYSLIYTLFEDNQDEVKKLLNSFFNNFILEVVGDNINFIKLTDSIRDYIERKGYSLNEKIMSKIKSQAKEILNNEESIFDYSEVGFYAKEALKLDIEMPRRNIIPSFYLNAMRELYNQEKRYSIVVKLANKILEYKNNIDSKFIDEVIYWCCLSLARQRDKEVLNRVQGINGIEHDFILGFYYRMVGKYNKALERLKSVLSKDINHFRAKRELVQVYLNIEEYDLAYNYAKQSYELDSLNPYNIQGYLRCVIKKKNIDKKDLLINKLLDSLKNNSHKKADEMYLTSKAQYIYYIKENYEEAIDEIDEAIIKYRNSIYPILVKLEIITNQENINYEMLNDTINEINVSFSKDSDVFKKIMYIYSKILVILNYDLDKVKAEDYFNREKFGLPDSVIEKIQKLF